MIITRYGTHITLTTKPDKEGWCKATFHFTNPPQDSPREVHLGDLRADDGIKEINEAIAALPAHDVQPRAPRPERGALQVDHP
jgi:hypothetical protein